MPESPNDPFLGLAEAAIHLHQLFVNLVAVGFTESQAIQLVAAIVVSGQRMPNAPTEEL